VTRDVAWDLLTKLTIAPITSTVRGLGTEVPLGRANGLDHACAASCDNLTTIPMSAIVRQVGLLLEEQEADLTRAINNAFDLR